MAINSAQVYTLAKIIHSTSHSFLHQILSVHYKSGSLLRSGNIALDTESTLSGGNILVGKIISKYVICQVVISGIIKNKTD